jgi:hypothetical protein
MVLIDKYVSARRNVNDLEFDLKQTKKYNKPTMTSKNYKAKKANIRSKIASKENEIVLLKRRLVEQGENPALYEGGSKRRQTRKLNSKSR